MKKLLVLILACLLIQPSLFSGRIINSSSSSANFLQVNTSKYEMTGGGTVLAWLLLPNLMPQTDLVLGAYAGCALWDFFAITNAVNIHSYINISSGCATNTDNGPLPQTGEWNIIGMEFNGTTQITTFITSESGGVRTVTGHTTTFGSFSPFVGATPRIQLGGLQNNSFDIGYLLYYNVVLTSNQIQAIANGASPTQVGPSPVGFYPLDNNAFPEVDLSPSPASLVQQGTVATISSTFPHGQAGMQRMKHY